jgi:hypothetical protein
MVFVRAPTKDQLEEKRARRSLNESGRLTFRPCRECPTYLGAARRSQILAIVTAIMMLTIAN